MELKDWGIAYGIVLSTISMVLHGRSLWTWWRDRERYELNVLESGKGRFDRKGKSFLYVDLTIKNRSSKDAFIESIGFFNSNGKEQPVFLDDLPIQLSGFETKRIWLWEGLRIAGGAVDLFVVNGRGTKFFAPKKQVERAVEIASRAAQMNNEFGITQHEYIQNHE